MTSKIDKKYEDAILATIPLGGALRLLCSCIEMLIAAWSQVAVMLQLQAAYRHIPKP